MEDNKLITKIDSTWIRFGTPKESSSFTGHLAGKYLFFSKSQQELADVASNEILNYNFDVAKISKHASGGDYVLCLYWGNDSRKRELYERYEGNQNLKYRWWKSNRDTRAGKYSQQFLDRK